MRERPFYILGDNLSVKQLLQAHGEDVVYRSFPSWLVKTNLTAMAIILPCALFIFIFGVIHDRSISDKACYMAPVPLVILPFIWVTSFWCEFWRPRKQASVGKQLMSVYYPNAVIKSDSHPDQIYFESIGQEICMYCRRYTNDGKPSVKNYCFYSFDMLFVPEAYLDEQCCEAYDYSAMLKDVHAYLNGKNNLSDLGISENMVGIIVDPRKPITKDEFDLLMSERDYIMKRFKLRLVSHEDYKRIINSVKERISKNQQTKETQTADAEYNARKTVNDEAIDHDKPENLLAWIRNVIDERCILAPVEEGISADVLTEIYLKEKAIGDKEGFIPVILQLDCNLIENVEENLHNEYVPIDNDEELSQRLITEMKENFCEPLSDEWNNFVGNEGDAKGQCLDKIDGFDFSWGRFVMTRIPSSKASDVFEYIPMGEWNDCPRPDVHQAMAKRWNKQYGATPCFISSDVILYYVPAPVGKETAFKLAMEHTAYCEDNVGQGVGTIWNLAKQLEKSNFWFFWWD